MLLSRVAENLYWGARYLERAEDTARLVRSFTELILDLPRGVASSWEPLLAVAGSREQFDAGHLRAGENEIVRFLVADLANRGSVVASVAQARENLRTTREVLPREAWQAVNDLFLFTSRDTESGVDRRSRARFLGRVMSECQRLDGVVAGMMRRDEAYELWRLGQVMERADMTTRVLGVRAASLLAATGDRHEFDEVQWMGVLRSLTALQMYQRSHRGPIDGASVVSFLLYDATFPRSVAGCVQQMRASLQRLPHADATLPAVDELDGLLSGLPAQATDGRALDLAMDQVQLALDALHGCVHDAFMRGVL
ncbi:MAG: alpha-E domain-containing protein [Actinomycetota bacterium]|nr:alpha-E domain-containing protein [Actinomycetota bacterium]